MHHRHVELFFHVIWSTWDRAPWIRPDLEREIRRCVHHHVDAAGAALLALGAADDHVHVLLHAGPTLTSAPLIGGMKGGASRWLHTACGVDESHRFSQGYALLSVSPELVERIKRYVETQRVRHALRDVVGAWEPPPFPAANAPTG